MPAQRQNQRSRPRKKDPNAPKKPHNPFLLYKLDNTAQFKQDIQEYSDAHKGSGPNKEISRQSFIHASKLLGGRWTNESVEVKQKYREAANELTRVYYQEIEARNARKLLEQQMREEEEEEEEEEAAEGEYGGLQWQENHNPAPRHGAPPFVEGGSSQANHQAVHMPQVFQNHATAPNSGRISVSGLNWNFNQRPIRNQRPLPPLPAFLVGNRFAPYTRPSQQGPGTVPPYQQTSILGSQYTKGNMAAPSNVVQVPQGRLNRPMQRRYAGEQNVNDEAFRRADIQLNQWANQQLPALDEKNRQMFGHTTARLNDPQQQPFIIVRNSHATGQLNRPHQQFFVGEPNGQANTQTFNLPTLSGQIAGKNYATTFNPSVVPATDFQIGQDFQPLEDIFSGGSWTQAPPPYDYSNTSAAQSMPNVGGTGNLNNTAGWNDVPALLNGYGALGQSFVADQHSFPSDLSNFDQILAQIHSPLNDSATGSPQDTQEIGNLLGSVDHYGQYF